MEWSDFRMKIREKAVASMEVVDEPPAVGEDGLTTVVVKEVVLKMKSGATARGRGSDLEECFNNLPDWVKVPEDAPRNRSK